MADSSFFALLDRTKYIARWGLMRSSIPENVQEHSMQVSVLAAKDSARGIVGEQLPDQHTVVQLRIQMVFVMTDIGQHIRAPPDWRLDDALHAGKKKAVIFL